MKTKILFVSFLMSFCYVYISNSPLKKFRLGIEAGIPLYQDYNGIQMNEDFGVNVGLLYNIL